MIITVTTAENESVALTHLKTEGIAVISLQDKVDGYMAITISRGDATALRDALNEMISEEWECLPLIDLNKGS